MFILLCFEFFQLQFPLFCRRLLLDDRLDRTIPIFQMDWRGGGGRGATIGYICLSFLLHSCIRAQCAYCMHVASVPASLLDESSWFPVGENLGVSGGFTSVPVPDGSGDETALILAPCSLPSPPSLSQHHLNPSMPPWRAAHALSIMLR